MNPRKMSEIIGGKRYSTETATLIAGDDFWDGHNFERRGTQTFLYRTQRGAYFVQHLTQREGQRDSLEPISSEAAQRLWEQLSERRVEFSEAFPGVKIEEA
jgi:hypothetical protein